MINDMLVSVVIASYKHEHYIGACIDSVAAQSHHRIELILVDDASTDKTFELAVQALERHSGRFERVEFKKNIVNRGAPFSLSRGMRLCRGRYIALLNSDDMFAPNRLEVLLQASNGAAEEFLFTGVETIDEIDNFTLSEMLCHQVMHQPRALIDQYPTVSWALLRGQLSTSTGNFFISNRLSKLIGEFGPYHYCHDWDYILRASWYVEPKFVDEPLYKYRLHGENSFRSLTHVASVESTMILKAHICRAFTSKSPNKLFPSPRNWPGGFESFCRIAQVGHLVRDLYAPYERHHRTISERAVLDIEDLD